MKQKKRKQGMQFLSMLLIIAMLFSGIGIPVRAEEKIFQIQSAEEFPKEILEGQTYELTKDIVLENGQYIEQLSGILDGKGYTITLADKPLADTVTGTIQNIGVTTKEGTVLESSQTFGSMANKLSGIIQNCYSTASLNLNGWSGEVGGLVGTLSGGTIRNSYMAGNMKAILPGGLVGVNDSASSVLKNSSYVNGFGAISVQRPEIKGENVVQSTLEQLRSGSISEVLNSDLPDVGFYWSMPENGENTGLPILKEGSVNTESGDKTALNELVSQAEQLMNENYTKESWDVFQNALKEATNILKKEHATQKELNDAKSLLEGAIGNLEKNLPTEPVKPSEEVHYLRSLEDFKKIENNGKNQYYVLDQDIVVKSSYFPSVDFEGVLDGKGHTIRFENGCGIFRNVEKEGVLQNIHFTGTMGGWPGGEYGPVGFSVRGAILNCYTEVTGEYASGFAKTLDGGILSNCYSISKGKLGALFYHYQSGKLLHTYWQEFLANVGSIPKEALIDSEEMSAESMKSVEFIEKLNKDRGVYATKWGQNNNGYPYFGENQEYNPEENNFPENKYHVRFQFHDGSEEVLDSQILRLSPDEVNGFRIAGKFMLDDVPQDSRITWEMSDATPSDAMLIGADEGNLGLYKEGTAIIRAVEIDTQGQRNVVATIKVIARSKVMEEIQLFMDEKNVTGHSVVVAGSEWKNLKVKARYQGEKEFVSVASSRFTYQASDSNYIHNMEGSGEFQFKKPGTASMTVTSKADSKLTATVEITSTYVPAVSIKPSISGVKILHGRNANSTDKQAFNPYYDGVSVLPENASYRNNWTVTSNAPEIAEYVDSMVKGYVPYRAGTVLFTASLEQTNPDTGKTNTITGVSEVSFAYKNPVTSITGSQMPIQIENFTEQKLDLTFEGVLSAEGYSVTEPELLWTYEGDGAVKIVRKETGYWKKEGFEGRPDYGEYLAAEEYYVTGTKEGHVKAIGTPLDKTGNAKPVVLEFEVLAGETPEVDIDSFVKKGIDSGVKYIENLHQEKGYAYNDEWDVYGLLRLGKNIDKSSLETYYKSVSKEVKTWNQKKKPTDIERVALTLSIMGKDITNVDGVNLAEMIYNHPNLNAGSNELSWALFALDAKNIAIPKNGKWTRERIISELLKFQNESTGGFGLLDNKMTSVDITAMSLQALAKYRKTDVNIYRAVEKGLQYLKRNMSSDYNYENSNSVSQVLLTLTILGVDPLHSEFGLPYENMITVLMNHYYCETEKGNGFVFQKGDRQINKMATVQAVQALTAYSQRTDTNGYWDLTDETEMVTAEKLVTWIANLPQAQELILEDEPVIEYLMNVYTGLDEKEKKKVTNYEILAKASDYINSLKTLGEEVGNVAITIMDGQRKDTVMKNVLSAKLDVWKLEAKGTILQKEIPIYEKDSMMTVIERACRKNDLDIQIRGGEYITSIDGLSEFDRGSGSGWMGTLNGKWSNKGFHTITVENGELKNGDAITVEYTMNLGEDLTENADLKTISVKGGMLQKEYQRDVYDYTVEVEEQDTITVLAETFNRYANVEITANGQKYQEEDKIPVEDGTKIILTSTKTVRGQETKTYTLTVKKEETKEQYLGVKTEAKVYDDFENDIWLQYQQKDMEIGEQATLRPWRLEQVISSAVANDVQRPNFRFEIIKGDSISLDTNHSKEKAIVTAKKAGTSVVKVTYDSMEYGGQTWGAVSPVNTVYVVYTVGEKGKATINCSENLKNWRHYDTIYYKEGNTVPFAFEVSADNADSLKVTVNGLEIHGEGNRYTANLENRSNIIGIEAKDVDGNIKSLYRIVDARFIEVNVKNKTHPDASLAPGDTANISFRGVTMPVYKLASIYNPVWTSDSIWGKSDATYISYKNEVLGEFKGQCQQWDLATNNDFDVTFEQEGDYTFTSEKGIFSEWWGSPLGADITANGSGEPNLNAPVVKDWFSILPAFTISVAEKKPVGSVSVQIQDVVQTPDGEDWPEPKGVILKDTNVSIYEDDTMMDAIIRACEENAIEISLDSEKTYITSVDGLEQFARGAASGWMGTLNGWFTDKGFTAFSVEDGDAITLEYTTNYGNDLTDTADMTGELKALGNSTGKVQPEYKRNVHKYELRVSKETKEVVFRPESFNRYNKVIIKAENQTYRYGERIPVSDGMLVEIISTPTKNNTSTGEKVETLYRVTVKYEEVLPNPEPEKPEQPEKPENDVRTLIDSKYGVSIMGKMLTEEMQLVVSKLTKEDSAVDSIRRAIPSSKGVFGLYHVTLMQGGKEIKLPGCVQLKLPVGEKYNGRNMQVLLHNNGKVESLRGMVSDGYIQFEVERLGDFGVVTELPSAGSEMTDLTTQMGNNGNQSDSVKTGDHTQPVAVLYVFTACVVIIGIGRKRRQGKER